MTEPFQMWVSPTDPDRACMSLSGQPNRLDSHGPAKFAGLYCTRDGGDSWTQMLHGDMSSAISSMAVVDTDPNVIYAGANASLQEGQRTNVTFTEGIVYKTTDGGITWQELPTGLLPNLRAFAIQVDQSNPDRVFVAMRSGVLSDVFGDEQLVVLRSDDGGASFVSLTNGLGPEPADRAIRHLFLSPNAPNRLFASSMGQPSAYITDDGGDTWTSIPENGAHAAWDPNDAEGDRLLLADAFSRNIRQSLDGGETFEQWGTLPEEYGSNPRQLRKLVFGSTPGRIYAAGTHASVLRSDDNGVTWRVILEEGMLPGQ